MKDVLNRALEAVDHGYCSANITQFKLARSACILAPRAPLADRDLPGTRQNHTCHGNGPGHGMSYQRISSPATFACDILGPSVFDRNTAQFVFSPGRSLPS